MRINIKNLKKGYGSAIICAVMMLMCFTFTLIMMRYYEIFNANTQTQLVSDTITTGSIVASQVDVIGTIDENLFEEKVTEMTRANSGMTGGMTSRIEYKKANYYIIEDRSRGIEYQDHKVHLNLNSHYTSPLIIDKQDTTGSFGAERATTALSLAKYAIPIKASASDRRALADALARIEQLKEEGAGPVTLTKNTWRTAAINYGALMLHWGYSGEARWRGDPLKSKWGSRDCSSFAISSICQFVGNGFPQMTGYTQTLYSYGLKKGYWQYWKNWAPKIKKGQLNVDDILIPGDIILTCGPRHDVDSEGNPIPPWSRGNGIVHAMIYLGNGMVMHANGGEVDGIHISRYSNWTSVGKKYNDFEGNSGIFGFIRIPDSDAKPSKVGGSEGTVDLTH